MKKLDVTTPNVSKLSVAHKKLLLKKSKVKYNAEIQERYLSRIIRHLQDAKWLAQDAAAHDQEISRFKVVDVRLGKLLSAIKQMAPVFLILFLAACGRVEVTPTGLTVPAAQPNLIDDPLDTDADLEYTGPALRVVVRQKHLDPAVEASGHYSPYKMDCWIQVEITGDGMADERHEWDDQVKNSEMVLDEFDYVGEQLFSVSGSCVPSAGQNAHILETSYRAWLEVYYYGELIATGWKANDNAMSTSAGFNIRDRGW